MVSLMWFVPDVVAHFSVHFWFASWHSFASKCGVQFDCLATISVTSLFVLSFALQKLLTVFERCLYLGAHLYLSLVLLGSVLSLVFYTLCVANLCCLCCWCFTTFPCSDVTAFVCVDTPHGMCGWTSTLRLSLSLFALSSVCTKGFYVRKFVAVRLPLL